MTADAALLAALADCAAALRRLKERAMAIASGRHKHLRIDQAKLDKARRIPRRDD